MAVKGLIVAEVFVNPDDDNLEMLASAHNCKVAVFKH